MKQNFLIQFVLIATFFESCLPSESTSPEETREASVSTTSIYLSENIQLNDSQPTLRSTNLEVIEGDSHNPVASLKVSLTHPSTKKIKVQYRSEDDDARSYIDYQPISGTLIFLPGELEKAVEIQIYSNTIAEGDRSFWVYFSSSDAVTLSQSGQYKVDIIDELTDAPAILGVSFSANETPQSNYIMQVGDGASQLKNIPIGPVQYIEIEFSIDVSIDREDLSLIEIESGKHLKFARYFTYDESKHTARWKISEPIELGRYTLFLNSNNIISKYAGVSLDGYWENPSSYDDLSHGSSFPSGGQKPGYPFEFRFNLLTCDLNQDNYVDHLDLQLLESQIQSQTYLAELDLNQDELINQEDIYFCEDKVGLKINL